MSSPPMATVGSQEMPEVADAIMAIRRDVGALRVEISQGLDKVRDSNLGFEERLLDVEETFLKDFTTRLDSLALDSMTTRVDIQALGLDIDQAHDHVCTTLDELRSGIFKAVQDSDGVISGRLDRLSKAIIDVNSRSKHAFLEIGRGLDVNHHAFVTRLDEVSEDINSTVCRKIDNVNDNLNKLVVETRDHLQDRFDEVQEEVESSRRRIHEKLNNVHEALAGIMNISRDKVLRKMERTTSLLSSMQPLMRELRKSQKG
ncbi:uncharacterized protein MAM_01749 [Metarhizium album ARSEF 1941]|uniref:Uncharacterized protein n=1 Tax=Metarhizium album (strain ARSEF 1941) TaxID=1081103 RepID=A0A0B2X6Q1_METAS|nr:uncharacterized protein MAM_01749 [Metarhizium album ARSEF 1941]KHO00971.1 hypothetical protein MAM_01749 [Metarhizium album ARSEF 1941]